MERGVPLGADMLTNCLVQGPAAARVDVQPLPRTIIKKTPNNNNNKNTLSYWYLWNLDVFSCIV